MDDDDRPQTPNRPLTTKITSWQEQTLSQVKDLLQPDDAVLAAYVVGSLADDAIQTDSWSDIDLVVVVSDQAVNRFHQHTNWLQSIDTVFATSRSADPPRFTLRVCFTDMRRIDFIFLLASSFADPAYMGLNHFQSGNRVLFSKSQQIKSVLEKESATELPGYDLEDQFAKMNNDFWFKGMTAVYKVIRNDLLIALHLALDLIRDCLVLQMMLRDRAKGTRHHRTGGPGNELIELLNAHPTEYSPEGILAMIEYSSEIFDDLSAEWSAEYETKREPLLKWASQAHEYLAHTEVRS